jgi:hypothetical protein
MLSVRRSGREDKRADCHAYVGSSLLGSGNKRIKSGSDSLLAEAAEATFGA